MESLFSESQHVIVDSSRSQCYSLTLLNESLENFRMNVSLIDSRVCWKEVHVFLSFNIPCINAFSFLKNNWERMVIMTSIFVLKTNIIRGSQERCGLFEIFKELRELHSWIKIGKSPVLFIISNCSVSTLKVILMVNIEN